MRCDKIAGDGLRATHRATYPVLGIHMWKKHPLFFGINAFTLKNQPQVCVWKERLLGNNIRDSGFTERCAYFFANNPKTGYQTQLSQCSFLQKYAMAIKGIADGC